MIVGRIQSSSVDTKAPYGSKEDPPRNGLMFSFSYPSAGRRVALSTRSVADPTERNVAPRACVFCSRSSLSCVAVTLMPHGLSPLVQLATTCLRPTPRLRPYHDSDAIVATLALHRAGTTTTKQQHPGTKTSPRQIAPVSPPHHHLPICVSEHFHRGDPPAAAEQSQRNGPKRL
jgi:hypothetical protein